MTDTLGSTGGRATHVLVARVHEVPVVILGLLSLLSILFIL